MVYDEKGRVIRNLTAPGGSLQGYTSSTYTIRQGGWVITYDEKGRTISRRTG